VKPSELRRVSDALAPDLVVVPEDAEDVCPMCRSWRDPTYDLCNNCEQAFRDLSAPCRFVVPISLYSKPSPMRDRLTYYKDPEDDSHAHYPAEVAAIVERFFAEHGERLQMRTGGWDGVCVVPSESRLPPHPLGEALRSIAATHVKPEVLLARGPGELGHRVLSDDAFVPTIDVRGRRVLVLDDVYTTGARCQGAASALTLAGADVVAIVVVGRRVNPSWQPGVQRLWERQARLSYDFHELPWWAS